ncbi:MAG: universal stress protein [Acidimicrobiales bacterium]
MTSAEEGPPDDDVGGPEPANPDEAALVEPAGKFRIYLGAAAGVGKTSAMLDEAWRRHQRGADVVVGYVEPHGRSYTAGLIRDLEVVPRRAVQHQGGQFEEMDLDLVLARRPELALVDELAHTNVPGSGRHEKRWEDVVELLDSGIAVITTVNIQHLESLADAVERMTGIKVRERVPDWVVRRADQVELIDSSPEQLRRRMAHGHVYAPEKVPQALTHFFRVENLTALRELALRFLADETEEEMLAYLRSHGIHGVWETKERIMAAVKGDDQAEHVIRRAARIAARAKADLVVVHVISGEGAPRASGKVIDQLRHLAADVGAQWHELKAEDPATALLHFAAEHQITQIVLAFTRRSRWEEVTKGSVLQKLLRTAGDAGVDVHVIAKRQEALQSIENR